MRNIASILTLSTILLAVGCAPADVAGNYTVSTSNSENECNFTWWDPSAESTGTPVVITQNGGDVQADVQGVVGGLMDVLIGSSTFNGVVGGSHISADLIGTVSMTDGGCTYTLRLELEADVDGDVITGNVGYVPSTNGHADCAILDSCQNDQLFNGTRPPSEG